MDEGDRVILVVGDEEPGVVVFRGGVAEERDPPEVSEERTLELLDQSLELIVCAAEIDDHPQPPTTMPIESVNDGLELRPEQRESRPRSVDHVESKDAGGMFEGEGQSEDERLGTHRLDCADGGDAAPAPALRPPRRH